MRHLIGVLGTFALLASLSFEATAATVVGCGVVAANAVVSGAGSAPRTFELRDIGAIGGRFSVPETMPLPTLGSYICGQFDQGAPFSRLVALLHPGDPGYTARAGILPSTTTAHSQTDMFGAPSTGMVGGPAATPAAAGCGRPLVGGLSACPGTVNVGATIVLEGAGCSAPGSTSVKLSFDRADGSGGVGLADITADASGRFHATFVVPAQLDPLQQHGGGPTTPGTYLFSSHPPYCTAEVTVAPGTLPSTSTALDLEPSSSSVVIGLAALGLAVALLISALRFFGSARRGRSAF